MYNCPIVQVSNSPSHPIVKRACQLSSQKLWKERHISGPLWPELQKSTCNPSVTVLKNSNISRLFKPILNIQIPLKKHQKVLSPSNTPLSSSRLSSRLRTSSSRQLGVDWKWTLIVREDLVKDETGCRSRGPSKKQDRGFIANSRRNRGWSWKGTTWRSSSDVGGAEPRNCYRELGTRRFVFRLRPFSEIPMEITVHAEKPSLRSRFRLRGLRRSAKWCFFNVDPAVMRRFKLLTVEKTVKRVEECCALLDEECVLSEDYCVSVCAAPGSTEP